MAEFCIDCGVRLDNILERRCAECYRKIRDAEMEDVEPLEDGDG